MVDEHRRRIALRSKWLHFIPPSLAAFDCPLTLGRAIERALTIGALAIGALTVDAIRILAQQGREQPSQWFNLDGRPHLQGHGIPPPHLDRYASLLPGGAQ